MDYWSAVTGGGRDWVGFVHPDPCVPSDIAEHLRRLASNRVIW